MSITNYLLGDTYGKVTGGKYNGRIIKLGGDKKFAVSMGKSIFDYILFVHLFKKDTKIYFKDITNYKVISNTFNSSTISIEANGEKHIINIQGQKNISDIVGLIEEKANLNNNK